MSGAGAIVDARHVIICAGPGGVGKTTTAAALALEAARRGRQTCVVTIDPAKRLADALGLEALGNEPHRVDLGSVDVGRLEPGGELWAVMLDTKATFDEVVVRHAGSAAQAEAILANRLYRNISGALGGTQEYMAMEKLYELHESGRFDLLVVDTPPTRHALDFLDAPGRLLRFLDNRIFRVLMSPTRVSVRAVNVATQFLLRAISRVVGGAIVADAVAFFEAFEGMEQGFRDRATRVGQLLHEPGTCFAVVAAPRRDAVDEAVYFVDHLGDLTDRVELLILNRMFPTFEPVPDAWDTRGGPVVEALAANLRELDRVAAREEVQVGRLSDRRPEARVVRVPYLADDVHDLEGLAAIAGWLVEAPATDVR